MKKDIREILSVINFQFEFGNRIVNNFRSLILVLILVKMWNVPKWSYPIIIILYGIGTWWLGWISDKIRLPDFFQNEYYRRSGDMVKDIKKIVKE